MKRRTFIKNTVAALPVIGAAGSLAFEAAGALEPIVLPKPDFDAALSLGAALKNRRTTRAVGVEPLPPQTLSNLLWAAFGVNRPEAGLMGKPGRTAPSASNSQEIDLYVALAQGAYLYEAAPHCLAPVAAWFHNCAKEDAARAFKLRPAQRVLFAQTVGFPAED